MEHFGVRDSNETRTFITLGTCSAELHSLKCIVCLDGNNQLAKLCLVNHGESSSLLTD